MPIPRVQPDGTLSTRRPAKPHHSPAWQRTSRRILKAWRAQHGDWCPGDQHHPPHHTKDLTVDHIRSLATGGAMYDAANTRVLCRQANSTKGTR